MYGDPIYCKKCGQMIKFIRTPRGKNAPVDSFSLQVVPRSDGSIYFLADGTTVRGIAVSVAGPNSVQAWASHHVTCPKGEYAMQKAARKPETWNETQARLAREKVEKERAAAAEAAARRAEQKRIEEAQREFENAQISIFP